MSYRKKPYRDKREFALGESDKLRRDIENLEDALLLHARFQEQSDHSIRGMIRQEIGPSSSRWEHGGEGKLTTYRSHHDLGKQDTHRKKTHKGKTKILHTVSNANDFEIEDRPHSRESFNSTSELISKRKYERRRESHSSPTRKDFKERQGTDRGELSLEISCLKAEWGPVDTNGEEGKSASYDRTHDMKRERSDVKQESYSTKHTSPVIKQEKLSSKDLGISGSKRNKRDSELDKSVLNAMKAKVLAKAKASVIDRTTFTSSPTSELTCRSKKSDRYLLDNKRQQKSAGTSHGMREEQLNDYISRKNSELNEMNDESTTVYKRSKSSERKQENKYRSKSAKHSSSQLQDSNIDMRNESLKNAKLSMRPNSASTVGKYEKDSKLIQRNVPSKWATSGQASPHTDTIINEFSQLSVTDRKQGRGHEFLRLHTDLSPRHGSESAKLSKNEVSPSKWAENSLASPPIETMVNRYYRRNSVCDEDRPDSLSPPAVDEPQRQSSPCKSESWSSHSGKSSHCGRNSQRENVANIPFKDYSHLFELPKTSLNRVVEISTQYSPGVISRSKFTQSSPKTVTYSDYQPPSPRSETATGTTPSPLITSYFPQMSGSFFSSSVYSGPVYKTSSLFSGPSIPSPSSITKATAQSACSLNVSSPRTFLTSVPTGNEQHSLPFMSEMPAAQMSTDVDPSQLKSHRALCDQEVESWLQNLGLQSVDRYIQLFADHQMDMASVRLLTTNGLRDMGINALGPIMKIMKGVQVLTRDERIPEQEKTKDGFDDKPTDSPTIAENNKTEIYEKDLQLSASNLESEINYHSKKRMTQTSGERVKEHDTRKANSESGNGEQKTQSLDKKLSSGVSATPKQPPLLESCNIGNKGSQSKVKVAHWKETSDEAGYANLNDRSPGADVDVPDFFTVKEKSKQIKIQKNMSDRKSATANGKGKSSKLKVTGKPPASSKTLDDGVSVAVQKVSTKQQQQRLKEEAEEKALAQRKQMRDEMAARHMRRRSSSLDRGSARSQRSSLERSASFSSVKDMFEMSPDVSARSDGVESVLSTKSLSRQRGRPEGVKLPKKKQEHASNRDAVSEMDDMITALQNSARDDAEEQGHDGQELTLGTIRELQKQLNHLEQHFVQQQEDTDSPGQMGAKDSQSGSREPSASRSRHSDEEASPRVSARDQRSARERRRQRAAKGWGPEEEGEGLVLSASFTDQVIVQGTSLEKNTSMTKSTQQRGHEEYASKTPDQSSNLSLETPQHTGSGSSWMSDILHVESLEANDTKSVSNRQSERISSSTSPTRTLFTSVARHPSTLSQGNKSNDSSRGGTFKKSPQNDDCYRRQPMRPPEIGASQIYHTANIKKVELDRGDIWFSDKDLLGDGAFSQVFKGTYQGLEVAVKRLKVPLQSRDNNYFVAEVSMLQELRHSHVVMLLGVCTASDKLPLMVLEYMACGNLHAFLHDSSRPSLSHDEYYQIARDVSAGMLYLHHHKPPVLHLDLKSRNVLIDHGNRAKVADFGFSKLKHDADVKVSRASKSRIVQGAPAWMAPELLTSGEVTAKADVYSFGIVLWEMLTRQTPYAGCSVFQTLENVRLNRRPAIPDHIPSGLTSLVQTCWHQNPAARLGFKAVLRHLESLSKSEEVNPSDAVVSGQNTVVSIDLSRENEPLRSVKEGERATKVRASEVSQPDLTCTSMLSEESEGEITDSVPSASKSVEDESPESPCPLESHRSVSSCSVNVPDNSAESHKNWVNNKSHDEGLAISSRNSTSVLSSATGKPSEKQDTAQKLIEKYLPSARLQQPNSKSYDDQLSKHVHEKLLPLRHSLDKPRALPAHRNEGVSPQILNANAVEKTAEKEQDHANIPIISSKPVGFNDPAKPVMSANRPTHPPKSSVVGLSRKSSADLLHLKKGVRPPFSDGQPYVPSFYDEVRQAKSRGPKSKSSIFTSVDNSDNHRVSRHMPEPISHRSMELQQSNSLVKSFNNVLAEPGLSLTKSQTADRTQGDSEAPHKNSTNVDKEKSISGTMPVKDSALTSNSASSNKLSETRESVYKNAEEHDLVSKPPHQAPDAMEHDHQHAAMLELPSSSELETKWTNSSASDPKSGTKTPIDSTENSHHDEHEMLTGRSLASDTKVSQSQNAQWLAKDTEYSENKSLPDNPLPQPNIDLAEEPEKQEIYIPAAQTRAGIDVSGRDSNNANVKGTESVVHMSVEKENVDSLMTQGNESDSDSSTILDISEDSLSKEDEADAPLSPYSHREPEDEKSKPMVTNEISTSEATSNSLLIQRVTGTPSLSGYNNHISAYNKNRESFFLFDSEQVSPPIKIVEQSEDEYSRYPPRLEDSNCEHLSRNRSERNDLTADDRTIKSRLQTSTGSFSLDLHHVLSNAPSASGTHHPMKVNSGPVNSQASLGHRTNAPLGGESTMTNSHESKRNQNDTTHIHEPKHEKQKFKHVPRHSSPTSSPNSRKRTGGAMAVTSSLLAEGRKFLKPIENSPSSKGEKAQGFHGNTRFSVEASMLVAQKGLLKSVVTREPPPLMKGVSEIDDETSPTVVSILKKAMTDRRFAMGDNQESRDVTPDASWSMNDEEL